jgi:DNA polymerase-3 subunit delta
LLYILYGPDDFSRHQALEEIKKSTGEDIATSGGATVLEGSQLSLNELKIACETVPFLAAKRLVIISGLLERYEPKNRFTPGKKQSHGSEPGQEWQPIAECFNHIPDTTLLILTDGEINEKNPLLQEISEKAQVKKFPLLKRKELVEWIQKRTTQTGGHISTAAAESLAKLVGSDLWTMSNEIDKLTAYAAGRVIDEGHVKALVSRAQETSVFTMVDAILEGKVGFAEELLQQLLQKGAVSTYLLAMLARQIRLDILAREMVNARKTKSDIQLKLGLADFALQKTLEQAQNYTMEQLQRFYEKLLEADISIKTGKYSEDLALNILVIELCQR